MQTRKLHDGRRDGLTPLDSLDLSKQDSFSDLVKAMKQTAFGGRQLGESLDILLAMVRDEACTVVLTVSGAMTVAKQGQIICDMVDRGLVDAVVATGALVAHGVTESIGLVHYAVDPHCNDEHLFEKGYNRIYDTLEMESNLDEVADLVSEVLDQVEPEEGVWCSSRFCRALGERLDQMNCGPGILRSAWQQDVPVFIPAFTDSEMGFDMSIHFMGKALMASQLSSDEVSLTADGLFESVPPFNPFLDMQEYARFVGGRERLGIFTIGGGAPRNWAQQIAPYYDVTSTRLGLALPNPRFRYGVRICPEPVHWGGLSGCTYSEGVSWGKFAPPSKGGRYAEVYADATLVLPLLMKAVFEELDGE